MADNGENKLDGKIGKTSNKEEGSGTAGTPNLTSSSPAPSTLSSDGVGASKNVDTALQTNRRQRVSETGSVDEKTKEVIRSVLRRCGSRGMTCLEFHTAARLNVRELGFRLLVDLLKSVPDVVELRENPETGSFMCFPVSTELQEERTKPPGRRPHRNDARNHGKNHPAARPDHHDNANTHAPLPSSATITKADDPNKASTNPVPQVMEQKQKMGRGRGRGILARDAQVSKPDVGLDISEVAAINSSTSSEAAVATRAEVPRSTATGDEKDCEVTADSNEAEQLTSHENKKGGTRGYRGNRGRPPSRTRPFPRQTRSETDDNSQKAGDDERDGRSRADAAAKPESGMSGDRDAQQEQHTCDDDGEAEVGGHRRPYPRRGRGYGRRGRGRWGRVQFGDGRGPSAKEDEVEPSTADGDDAVEAENSAEAAEGRQHDRRGRGHHNYRGRRGHHYRRHQRDDPQKEASDEPGPDDAGVHSEKDHQKEGPEDDQGAMAKRDSYKPRRRPYYRRRRGGAPNDEQTDTQGYQEQEPQEDFSKPVTIRVCLTKKTEEDWNRDFSVQDLPPKN